MFSYFETGISAGIVEENRLQASYKQLCSSIRANTDANKIIELRKIDKSKFPDNYRKLKNSLPFVQPHGIFKSVRNPRKPESFKNELVTLSNFLYFDIDKCDITTTKEKLLQLHSDKICLLGKSVGGRGLFFFIKFGNEGLTVRNFNSVHRRFFDLFSKDFDVDECAASLSRNFVIPLDENVYENNVSIPFLTEYNIIDEPKKEEPIDYTNYLSFLKIKNDPDNPVKVKEIKEREEKKRFVSNSFSQRKSANKILYPEWLKQYPQYKDVFPQKTDNQYVFIIDNTPKQYHIVDGIIIESDCPVFNDSEYSIFDYPQKHLFRQYTAHLNTFIENYFIFKGEKVIRGNFLSIHTWKTEGYKKSEKTGRKEKTTYKIQVGKRGKFIKSWQNVIMFLNPNAPFGTVLNFLNQLSNSDIEYPKPYHELFEDVRQEYVRIKTEGIYRSTAFKIEHFLINNFKVTDRAEIKLLKTEHRKITRLEQKTEMVKWAVTSINKKKFTREELLMLIEKEHIKIYTEKLQSWQVEKKLLKKKHYIGVATLEKILDDIMPDDVEILIEKKERKKRTPKKLVKNSKTCKEANSETGMKRSSVTSEKIQEAVEFLKRNNEKITEKRISELTDVSERNIRRYKKKYPEIFPKNPERMKPILLQLNKLQWPQIA